MCEGDYEATTTINLSNIIVVISSFFKWESQRNLA